MKIGKPGSRNKFLLSLGLVGAVAYYFCLPEKLFLDPYSTVLLDRKGSLLSAKIADDGQWRFPVPQAVPEKLRESMILFEDKRFYSHPGVDLVALARATVQNIGSGKVVSGASTISMQTIRLARKNPSRTILEKVMEIVMATRLELRYTKEEILNLYSAHAPYGGNVVGIQAAAWRYFGREPSELSWAEAALLAVLPNNPSLIHLGRNRNALKEKRDFLLEKLKKAGKIDDETFELSKLEELPESPRPLPRHATHLLERLAGDGKDQQTVTSTLDATLQHRAETVVNEFSDRLKGNQIFNLAAVIVEVNSGNVLAYVGNSESGSEHHEQVDIVTAPRSTGSILKPFLYAAMLDEGKIMPSELVPDVPTIIDGFAPKNFSHTYDGAVPANQALIRSLNVPAVHELREYRYEKFYNILQQYGLTTLTNPPDHYGLSLVLGGAEGTLWDITGAYASMARTLNQYFEHAGKARYQKTDIRALQYVYEKPEEAKPDITGALSAGAIWLTFDALKELYRPGEETGWRHFTSSRQIAWKTGTSFGFRDAWAVGVTPDYAVGVWAGNADGEGRPGLTGTEAAAPVLFELFDQLGGRSWFSQPSSELFELSICSKSGLKASSLCGETKLQLVTASEMNGLPCGYHKQVHLSRLTNERVNSDCMQVDQMKTVSWFVLPPVEEYYYKGKHLDYQPLPPFAKECRDPSSLAVMDVIYPKEDAQIFVPHELDGTLGKTLFEAVHRSAGSTLYWHIDGDIVAVTKTQHRVALTPAEGEHTLTLVDQNGEMLTREFKILGRP